MDIHQLRNRFYKKTKDDLQTYIDTIRLNHFWVALLTIITAIGYFVLKTTLSPILFKYISIYLIFILIIIVYHSNDYLRLVLYIILSYSITIALEYYSNDLGFLPYVDKIYNKDLFENKFEYYLFLGSLWSVISISANTLINNYFPDYYLVIRILFAGLIIVSIDVLIEQVSMIYKIWDWSTMDIPVLNYVFWFATGIILSIIFNLILPHYKHKVASTAFIIIFVCLFFMLIDIF